MPMSFIMSKKLEHPSEKTPKGRHGEIYKFHTSVISTHFLDQVQLIIIVIIIIIIIIIINNDFLKHKQANINVKSRRFGIIMTPFSRQNE